MMVISVWTSLMMTDGKPHKPPREHRCRKLHPCSWLMFMGNTGSVYRV